MKQAQNMKT